MSWLLYGLASLLIFISSNWYVLPVSNPRCWIGVFGMIIGIMLVFNIGLYKGEHK